MNKEFNYTSQIIAKAQKIKLLLLDVDGVMTNNCLYYSDNGGEIKSFYTRDGHGIVLLHKHNIKTGIITGRKSKLVSDRARDLKITYLFQGAPDKLPIFEKLVQDERLVTEQIAYIGDDILDIPILSRVGLSVAPNDCDPFLNDKVDLISKFGGGKGVVREICELILKTQNKWQDILDFYTR